MDIEELTLGAKNFARYMSSNGDAGQLVRLEAYPTDVVLRRSFAVFPLVENRDPAKRDVVEAFSRASMRRAKFTVRQMPMLSFMITLTYPGSGVPASVLSVGRLVKRHLDTFIKFLKSQSVLFGFWFLEFQKRGVPHFHIFTDVPVDHRLVSRRWFEIVGSGEESHLRAGTRVEKLNFGHLAASSYVAKYAVKHEQKDVPEDYSDVGRFWGYWPRGSIKPLQVFDGEEALYASRLIRRWNKSKFRGVCNDFYRFRRVVLHMHSAAGLYNPVRFGFSDSFEVESFLSGFIEKFSGWGAAYWFLQPSSMPKRCPFLRLDGGLYTKTIQNGSFPLVFGMNTSAPTDFRLMLMEQTKRLCEHMPLDEAVSRLGRCPWYPRDFDLHNLVPF